MNAGGKTSRPMGTVTLLRAELAYGDTTIVGHTTALTPNRAFVRTDDLLEIGTSVELTLSFRGALSPLRFRGVVDEHRHPSGPGDLGGLWFAIEACSDADRERLRAMLDVAPSAREVRLLMVEDSSLTRDVFTHSMSHAPSAARVRLESVPDAEVAWTHLQNGDYHLLLVDHFLPSSTGAELIERVRSEPRLCALPIVGISVGGKVARDAMLTAGVDLFLEKPVQVRDLLATLDRLAGLGEEAPS
jgi:CheY-like chemotaxis protein